MYHLPQATKAHNPFISLGAAAPSNISIWQISRAPVGALYQPLELVDPLLVGGGGVQEIGRHGGKG